MSDSERSGAREKPDTEFESLDVPAADEREADRLPPVQIPAYAFADHTSTRRSVAERRPKSANRHRDLTPIRERVSFVTFAEVSRVHATTDAAAGVAARLGV